MMVLDPAPKTLDHTAVCFAPEAESFASEAKNLSEKAKALHRQAKGFGIALKSVCPKANPPLYN